MLQHAQRFGALSAGSSTLIAIAHHSAFCCDLFLSSWDYHHGEFPQIFQERDHKRGVFEVKQFPGMALPNSYVALHSTVAPKLAELCSLRSSLQQVTLPVTANHHTISYSPLVYQYFIPLFLCGAREYDAIVCSSLAARKAITTILAYIAENLTSSGFTGQPPSVQFPVIPFGVDDEFFRPVDKEFARTTLGWPKDPFVFLWVGRFAPEDKADLVPLISVFARLRSRLAPQPMMLVLAGNDSGNNYSHFLEETAAELGVGAFVKVVRGAPTMLLPILYSASDAFVSPADNIQECFGVTVIEAMACGLPVLAADWSGYRELVEHGRNGFLIPTYWPTDISQIEAMAFALPWVDDHFLIAQATTVDHCALFTAMSALARNLTLSSEMGRVSRGLVKDRFTLKRVAAAYDETWASLYSHAQESSVSPSAPGFRTFPYSRIFKHFATQPVNSSAYVEIEAIGLQCLNNPNMLRIYSETQFTIRPASILSLLKDLLNRSAPLSMEEAAFQLAASQSINIENARLLVCWMLKRGLIGLRR